MSIYTRRIQAVLTDEQFEALTSLAHESGKPLSALVRDAIEAVYFRQAMSDRREAALGRLLSLQAPVTEWSEMEEEIARGANRE